MVWIVHKTQSLAHRTWCAKRPLLSGLVRMFANISSVGQYCTSITPYCIASLMKLRRISVCFVHLWYTGFFDMAIVPWLSFITAGWLFCIPRLRSYCRSHTTSWTVELSQMYSPSAVEGATVACWQLIQLTAAPANIKAFPVLECLFSMSFAQSASGVQTAASPWCTLGIGSCRTFCSDLAW